MKNSNQIKVLSIHQPWAWAIVSGYKKIENRSWITNHRGFLLIHATATRDLEADTWIEKNTNLKIPTTLPQKNIVGGVTLKDIKTNGAFNSYNEKLTEQDKVWAFLDYKHWLLENPEKFEQPTPYSGKMGIWTINANEVDMRF